MKNVCLSFFLLSSNKYLVLKTYVFLLLLILLYLCSCKCTLIVSIGGIQWSGYFGLAFATPPSRVERFTPLMLSEEITPARFTKFARYLHWWGGGSFSETEISLILKNKMAAAGISLKIIYIFLLAVSHR